MTEAALKSAQIIQDRLNNIKIDVGIVCGSGLGDLAQTLKDPICFNYQELCGFPKLTVEGHFGQLVIGRWGDKTICLLKGRKHFYEGVDLEAVKTYVRTLKLLGSQIFIATNASGSLRKDLSPGSLMIIRDHINLQGINPLLGPNDEKFGPRFPSMANAYDAELRDTFCKSADKLNLAISQGVYVSVLGPCFETAAEIKAYQLLGGDAVGMSTAAEVIVARHCGMRVAAIATITNWGTGLFAVHHDHKSVLAVANQMGDKLGLLLQETTASLP